MRKEGLEAAIQFLTALEGRQLSRCAEKQAFEQKIKEVAQWEKGKQLGFSLGILQAYEAKLAKDSKSLDDIDSLIKAMNHIILLGPKLQLLNKIAQLNGKILDCLHLLEDQDQKSDIFSILDIRDKAREEWEDKNDYDFIESDEITAASTKITVSSFLTQVQNTAHANLVEPSTLAQNCTFFDHTL